jgi:hypothetical protein
MTAACRRVNAGRSSQCGRACPRRTAPEHETRVAGSSARARLVVVTARHGCIAASCACTLHNQGPSGDRRASRLRVSSATSADQRASDKAKMGGRGVEVVGKLRRELPNIGRATPVTVPCSAEFPMSRSSKKKSSYPGVPSLGPVAKFATLVGICADVQKGCTFSSVRRHIIYEGAVGIIVESIPV